VILIIELLIRVNYYSHELTKNFRGLELPSELVRCDAHLCSRRVATPRLGRKQVRRQRLMYTLPKRNLYLVLARTSFVAIQSTGRAGQKIPGLA
jgi:hypothetical protein